MVFSLKPALLALSFLSVCAVVPSPVPKEFVRATPSEDKISLRWKEPLEPNGIITQYEVMLRMPSFRFVCLCANLNAYVSKVCALLHHVCILSKVLLFVFYYEDLTKSTICIPVYDVFVCLQISYISVHSFDPSVPLLRPPVLVSLPWNTSRYNFTLLQPGTTYQFLIRASTSKGFGPPTTLNVTTNISGVCMKWCCVCQIPSDLLIGPLVQAVKSVSTATRRINSITTERICWYGKRW